MSLAPEPETQQYPEPAEPVRARRIGDELVIPLDVGFALVASATEADVWHVVERGRCDCKAFLFREQCRHIAVAAAAVALAACYRCGAPTRRPPAEPFPLCGPCAKAAITLADD